MHIDERSDPLIVNTGARQLLERERERESLVGPSRKFERVRIEHGPTAHGPVTP